jgi:hypothetical protein
MTGKEIIAAVLARTGVTEADFFGPRRARPLTEARIAAIDELTQLGLSPSAIGRIVRRNHVTVLYWQKPEMRQARKAAYEARRPRQPKAEPKPRQRRKPRNKPAPAVKAPRNHCFYTAEEDATARALHIRGADGDECRRILGRSRDSVRKRIRLLDDPAFREACHRRDRARYVARKERRDAVALQVPKGCEALFEQARARATAHRSLTAAIFGDPPPGQSALDRRSPSEARV